MFSSNLKHNTALHTVHCQTELDPRGLRNAFSLKLAQTLPHQLVDETEAIEVDTSSNKASPTRIAHGLVPELFASF